MNFTDKNNKAETYNLPAVDEKAENNSDYDGVNVSRNDKFDVTSKKSYNDGFVINGN